MTIPNGLEIHGVCRFHVLLDMKNKDIFDKLQEAYSEGCVSYAWVCKWAKAFRDSRTSFADHFRSARSPIPDGVEREPYQSDLAKARDIVYLNLVLEVLRKVLKEKHSLRWVLHTLNGDQKLPSWNGRLNAGHSQSITWGQVLVLFLRWLRR
jgi:hypothetical protein